MKEAEKFTRNVDKITISTAAISRRLYKLK